MREIAFKMMVHAHVPDELYDVALEHSWKIFNCSPIRDGQLVGKPCTRLESHTGNKPDLTRFRFLFCPCVLGMGEANQRCGPVTRQNNCPERGIRGIHVGLPCCQDGWLCCPPSTGGLRVCLNVAFDENFHSATAHSPSQDNFWFPGSQRSMQISLPMISLQGDLKHTGDAWPFTSVIGSLADPTDPNITCFVQQHVEETHDNDDRTEPPLVACHSFEPDDGTSDEDDDSHNKADGCPCDHAAANILLSEDFDELFIEPASRQAQFIPPTALAQDD
jgi:hypothetical protein